MRRTRERKVELPFQEWPEADREAWEALFIVGDPLEDAGTGRHWAARTRVTNRHHYGRWLAWLEASGALDATARPWERATPERIRGYGEDLLANVAPRTVASVLIGLKVVLKAMQPEADWRWLMDLTNRLNTWARPSVDRTAQTLPIERIHNASLRELDRLQQTPLVRRIDRVAYRDALIMLVLSAAPVRLRNLAMIEIGTHLHITGSSATLRFNENETKNRQRLTYPLPRHLLPYLQVYLDRIRPSFGTRGACDRLWLGFEGRPLTAHSIYGRDPPHHPTAARRKDQPAQLSRLRRHQPRRPLLDGCARRGVRCSDTATSPRPSGTTFELCRWRRAGRLILCSPTFNATPVEIDRHDPCRHLRPLLLRTAAGGLDRRPGAPVPRARGTRGLDRRRGFLRSSAFRRLDAAAGPAGPLGGGLGRTVRDCSRRGARPAEPRPGGHRRALQAADLRRTCRSSPSPRARSPNCTSASKAR